jgi:hypothetical protein
VIHEDGDEESATQIICSLGLIGGSANGN